MTDLELLQEYVRTGSQEAFAQVVRAHVDMVYSTARRRLAGDAHLAEDVTQRVFTLLATKAATLKREVLLGGWLYNTAVLVATDLRRSESRRAERERKAAKMAEDARQASSVRPTSAVAADSTWSQAEDVLDEAMSKLGPSTRGLLVLRFFEGKSAREVADRLGISEEAARKRVSRAVDELRDIFARRGVAMTSAGLTEVLAINAITKAPEALAASAASAATSSVISSSATGAGAFLMASAATKVTVGVVGAIALAGGIAGSIKAYDYFSGPRARTVTVTPKGPLITGIVRAPDGKIATGAEFFVGVRGKTAYAYGSNMPRGVAAPVTDADGKFSAEKPDQPFAVVVRSPQGYAEVSSQSLQSNPEITLKPWARIEGVMQSGGKPIANANVRLWRVGENNELVHHETSVKTDANGKFVIPQVAPGELCLYRQLPNFRSAQWRYVIVEPGETAKVVIGDSGQAVTGRIDIPPDMAKFVKWENQGRYTYEASIRLDPNPTGAVSHTPDESLEEYWAKEIAFGKTPEGKLYKEWRFGSQFEIKPDGTFRIEDLRPGKYNVNVRCFEHDEEVAFMEDIASAELSFEISPSATTQSTAIDVGTTSPKVVARVLPGSKAPDFSVKTIDGQTWNYADHRGKPLVLIFWGTYSNTDRLKPFGQFVQKWGKDPGLSILGCFSAENPDEARKLIAEYKLDFPQTDDLSLMSKFGSSWPEAVVVSADGVILKKHLHDKVLEKYVKQALAAATQPTKQ